MKKDVVAGDLIGFIADDRIEQATEYRDETDIQIDVLLQDGWKNIVDKEKLEHIYPSMHGYKIKD